MKVELNLARESLTLRLEGNDAVSTREVQSALRAGGVAFVTLDARGVWQIGSAQITALQSALSTFSPEWSPPAEKRLAIVHEDALSREGILPAGSLESKRGFLPGNGLQITPYDEQIEAASYMAASGVRRFALFWKPGTGKTGALIAAAYDLLLNKIVGGVLVVAERPTAIHSPWVTELNAWLPEGFRSGSSFVPIQGDKRRRLQLYLEDPTWALIHYGLMETDRSAIKAWADRNSSLEPPIIIFDESDLIKNPDANRSRAAMDIRKEFGRCWIASGTPAPNSPADYEHQMSVLCGYPVGLRLGGNREEDALVVIHELTRGVYYLQQENPRKMPETIYPVVVPLTDTQRSLYERLARGLLSDLESMDDQAFNHARASVMARRMDLFRVCSDPAHESLVDFDFTPSAKTLRIDDLLDEILADPQEKVVIWSRFRDTAKNLFERYKQKWGASLLIGGGEGRPEDLFQPECRLMIAVISMGASSISLTAASNAIYESLDEVSRNFSQSLARINRTGQSKDCRYWILVSDDTIEQGQLERTMGKVELSEEVLEEIGGSGRAELIEQLKRSLATSE